MSVIYKPTGKALEYAQLALNLYEGCGHKCQYCYAPAATRKDKNSFWNNPKPRNNIIERTEKDLKKIPENSPPILLCFTCDPYQPMEKEHEITRQAIKLIKEKGLSVQILTKGGSLATRDFDLLDESDCFASTLTFVDPLCSQEWEPGAALPQERIENLIAAKKAGIKTWVSLEPVILTTESLKLIDLTHEYVDLFKVGRWNHAAAASAIDWKRFGEQAIQKFQDYGKNYYIKKDLAKYLEPTTCPDLPKVDVKEAAFKLF